MEINDNVKEVFIDVLFTFESLKKAFLIIEHEWDQDSSYKLSYIDLPMGFVEEYIDTLNLVLSKENFSRKAIDGINQRIENFTRNFDNPFFQTNHNKTINSLIAKLMDSSRKLDKM